ncbi:hypothetical protein HAX54_031281 [Datura stramonium]|uniref:Uncharacterized protein n=1 Tax=Datura stramonium TaxID=4076 RepID=A0ABS8V9Y7_DATST|nr:hypothetical protein [Datura stramonium]
MRALSTVEEFLLDEIEKVEAGIYQVFKALDNECDFVTANGWKMNKCIIFWVGSLVSKHDRFLTAYIELKMKYSQVLEENETLLQKITEIKEEKWLVEQENDAFLLDGHNLHGVIGDFDKGDGHIEGEA